MKLNWQLDPKHLNVQKALSAAYQYRVQDWNDGQAALTVQHRGDRPSGKPVKYFVYKNRKASHNGAQRFENTHGYADPAHHAPAAVVPFLPELPERVTRVIDSMQKDAQSAAQMVEADAAPPALADEMYEKYTDVCAAVLCCDEYDCYTRTEIGERWCAEHRAAYGMTED